MTREKARVQPPTWNDRRLEKDLEKAIEFFRDERMREPLDKYLEEFDAHRNAFEELLETTVDLTAIADKAMEILTNESLLAAVRYLPGPPISLDDLRVVVDAPPLNEKNLRADPALASRIIETVMAGLDRRRFPWVSDGREASEQERAAAVLASAAILASSRVQTSRRSTGKETQERAVRETLREHGFVEADTRRVAVLSDSPGPGEFCKEINFGPDKADVVVGLWDRRVMAIECKVSNSATNSIKRLNKDAAVKAVRWRKEFGDTQVVPVAVLSGVYALRNLQAAQRDGLTLFWAHSLDEMTAFIDKTRSP